MSELSAERMDEIRKRCKATTGGYWVVVHDGTERSVATTESGRFICHLNSNMPRYSDDADFIAYAHADIADLLAALEAATTRLAAVEAEAAEMRDTLLDTLDCLHRVLDGSRPFTLSQREELRLAIETLTRALLPRAPEGE